MTAPPRVNVGIVGAGFIAETRAGVMPASRAAARRSSAWRGGSGSARGTAPRSPYRHPPRSPLRQGPPFASWIRCHSATRSANPLPIYGPKLDCTSHDTLIPRHAEILTAHGLCVRRCTAHYFADLVCKQGSRVRIPSSLSTLVNQGLAHDPGRPLAEDCLSIPTKAGHSAAWRTNGRHGAVRSGARESSADHTRRLDAARTATGSPRSRVRINSGRR